MIIADFSTGCDEITTAPVTEWDYGRTLHIIGLSSLPEIVQVHFCDETCEKTIVRVATKNDDGSLSVSIPDKLMENKYGINAYIYLRDTAEGKTVKRARIPLIPRKQPEDYVDPGDPTVNDKLTQLLEAVEELNNNFARVYGTNNEQFDIQLCDEAPTETESNRLYIYPDSVNLEALKAKVDEISPGASAPDKGETYIGAIANLLGSKVQHFMTQITYNGTAYDGTLISQVSTSKKYATQLFIGWRGIVLRRTMQDGWWNAWEEIPVSNAVSAPDVLEPMITIEKNKTAISLFKLSSEIDFGREYIKLVFEVERESDFCSYYEYDLHSEKTQIAFPNNAETTMYNVLIWSEDNESFYYTCSNTTFPLLTTRLIKVLRIRYDPSIVNPRPDVESGGVTEEPGSLDDQGGQA